MARWMAVNLSGSLQKISPAVGATTSPSCLAKVRLWSRCSRFFFAQVWDSMRRRRRRRHSLSMRTSTRQRSAESAGLKRSRYSAARSSRASADSSKMIWDSANMPCLRALKRDLALPSVVRGPVEFWELARLAADCLSVGIKNLSAERVAAAEAEGWRDFG